LSAQLRTAASARQDAQRAGRLPAWCLKMFPAMSDDAALTLRLPRRTEAPAAARKALATLNGDLHLVSGARLADAQLLVTELVSNAVRNGTDDSVALVARVTPSTLRVEVANAGSGFDPAQVPAPSHERPGGWGLRIVDVLAPRWGVEPHADGVLVWFELDRPAADAALPLTGSAPPPE
jgi:anti-sigma regulatory factor (Ser/Thr protein kinase)